VTSAPRPSSGWWQRRLDIASLRRSMLDREMPGGLTWWHTLGSATLTVFLLQAVTGAVLAMYYAPSPDHAYESIRYLEGQVHLGRVLRGVHNWGASAMVVLALLHMVRVFSFGAYKYPREANWVVGVGLLGLVMAFGFTGYLLPWDQRAYWATQVGTSIAGTVPGVGGAVAVLLRGGTQLGAETLTRFYALHVLWLPAAIIGLIGLHLVMIVRQGIAAPPRVLEEAAPARTDADDYAAHYDKTVGRAKRGGPRFWPDIIAKDAVVSLLTVAVIVGLAMVEGAPLEAPADPTDTSYVPLPEWYFLPFYQLLKLVPGSMESTVAVGIPAFLALTLLGLPFFDRSSRRHLRGRPLALAGLVAVLGGSALLLGAALGEIAPPSESPSGVALSSVERAGRATFQRQCAGCHVVGDEGGEEGPELTDIGTRHGSAWLHSFIENPQRFHPESEMSSFGPPTLSHQEIEEVARYLTTLRGPRGQTLPMAIADTFPEPSTPVR